MDAYELSHDVRYQAAAWDQIHYLLGRNSLDVSFLTGVGTNPIVLPHHRPSGASGRTMPGMISGGPCDWMADEPAKNFLEGKDIPPAKCFLDHTGSYSTNEVTIYWNSAFILLLASLLGTVK